MDTMQKKVLLIGGDLWHPLEIIARGLRVFGRDEDIIGLSAHRKGGIEHILRALLEVGDVAHQVDLAVLQHLQEF